MREWAAEEKLSDYDIQCYNIKDKISILGHTFNGLKDIREHIELYGREGFDGLHCWSPTEVEPYKDVHIGHFYENYPIFDSYDLGDDRTYQNYIFRNTPITENDMKNAFGVSHRANFCMVHENIPEEKIPSGIEVNTTDKRVNIYLQRFKQIEKALEYVALSNITFEENSVMRY